MLCFPNAKINIGLNIIGKRTDGYHNIESIFYPVDYCDVLEAIPSKKFNFIVEGISIPSKVEDNLTVKAFKLIKKKYQVPNVELTLLKDIPIGAGLGGGSSDATFTLTLLNKVFKLNINKDTLANYAASLGSDCSFFLKNTPLFVSGTGNKFEEIDFNLKGYNILIVSPMVEISTKEAYENISPKVPKQSLKGLIKNPVENWKNLIINDFEEFVFQKHPEIRELIDSLYNSGAIYTSLTGSGSSVYALFKEKISCDNLTFKNSKYWIGVLN